MKTFVYERIKNAEETDWWYMGLRQIVAMYLRKYYLANGRKLLDVGCGTGYFLKILKKDWEVFGVDISQKAITMSRSRGLENIIQGSIEKLPYANDSFDVILVLDVIEHVKNDVLALSEVYRVLKPNGIAVFNTPAFKFLWSYHDISADHVRRYTQSELTGKLQKVKFKILKVSYINFLLFPLALIQRLIAKFFPPLELQTAIGVVPFIFNQIFYKIFTWEKLLLETFNLPWGLSVSAVVTK